MRTIALLILIGLCSADAQPNARPSSQPASDSAGRAVLQRMHDAYAGRWYTTLRFVQKTTQYQADGKKVIATWYESLRQPAAGKTQLRIDIGDPHDGSGVLYTADSSWRFRDGKLAAARASGNEFLPMIEGVYFQPVGQTIAELASTKIDFSRVVHGSWQGQPVTIIGAASVADTSSPQLWIEDGRNVAVRLLLGPSGPQALDIKLDDYVAVGSGWLATKIVMTRGGMPLQTEEYADWKTGVDLPDAYFSATAWVPASHWAYR